MGKARKGKTIEQFCDAHGLNRVTEFLPHGKRLEDKGYLVTSRGSFVIPREYEEAALKIIQSKPGFFAKIFGGGKKAPEQTYKPLREATTVSTAKANGESVPLEERVTPKSTPAVSLAGTPAPRITGTLVGQGYPGEDAGEDAGQGSAHGNQSSTTVYQPLRGSVTYRTHPELAKVTEADFRVDINGNVAGKEIIDIIAKYYNVESRVLEDFTSRDLSQGIPPELFANARVQLQKAIDYINDFGNKYAAEYSGPSLEELSAEDDQAASGADVTNDPASPEEVSALQEDVAGLAPSKQTERYARLGDEMERVFVPVLGRAPAERRITEIMDSYIAYKGWRETADGISVDQNITPNVLSKILGMDTTDVVRRLKKIGID